MRSKLIVGGGAMALALVCLAYPVVSAQSDAAVALTGVVRSMEEGAMEGVVVGARRDGANFTVSVVSDAQGRYHFPRTHLEPGSYELSVRAVGYDLPPRGPLMVTTSGPATADLQLVVTKDLASQLSSLEWTLSTPGGPDE